MHRRPPSRAYHRRYPAALGAEEAPWIAKAREPALALSADTLAPLGRLESGATCATIDVYRRLSKPTSRESFYAESCEHGREASTEAITLPALPRTAVHSKGRKPSPETDNLSREIASGRVPQSPL